MYYQCGIIREYTPAQLLILESLRLLGCFHFPSYICTVNLVFPKTLRLESRRLLLLPPVVSVLTNTNITPA